MMMASRTGKQFENLLIGWLLLVFASSCGNRIKPDRQIYIADPDYSLADGDATLNEGISAEKTALSGDKSILLTPGNPYGLTLSFSNVQPGEVFEACLFRYGGNPCVKLVYQGSNFYHEASWATASSGKWECVCKRFCVPAEFEGNELKVFGFLACGTEEYIDSLSVVRYAKASDATDSLLPGHTFYPLLFDVINTYHIKHSKELSPDSLAHEIQLESNRKIFIRHGVSQIDFTASLQKRLANNSWSELIKQLGEMKEATAMPAVVFKWEDMMEKRAYNGFSDKIIYAPDDTINMTFSRADGIVKVMKLLPDYRQSFYSQLNITGLKMAIPAGIFPLGFYNFRVTAADDAFDIPVIINHRKPSDIVLLAPVSTWHAYNSYGGKSFYRNFIDSSDVHFLSAERPLASVDFDSAFCGHDLFILMNMYEWFNAFSPTQIYPDYYLEAHPELFKGVKTIVLAQHCEYFSQEMFARLKALSSAANILSLGGNQIYWKIKWSENYKAVECRKDGTFFHDTHIPGGLWRNDYWSEAAFMGVAFTNSGYATYSPYRAVTAEHPFFNGMIKDAQLFGLSGVDKRGLSGDEMDKTNEHTPANATLLAKGTNTNNGGGELVYIDRGAVGTIACGSIACGSGLGVDSVFSGVIKSFLLKHHEKGSNP